MILTELFNEPYKWGWNPGASEERVTGGFRTDDNSTVSVDFELAGRQDESGRAYYMFSFARNGSMETTGEGDAFKIFATVAQMIEEFVKDYRPDVITFTANDGEPARKSLFKRMLPKLARKLGLRYQITGNVFHLINDSGDGNSI